MASAGENALDRCLEWRRAGEPTTACVADLDPALRAEVEALLETAEAVWAAPRPGLPPAALIANERRLLARAAELRGERPASRPVATLPRWERFGWRPSLVPAAILLVLLLSLGILTGVRTVVASAGPNDALYPVKRSLEQAQVALAPTAAQRAHAQVDVAQGRIDEMAALVRERRPIPGWLVDQAEAAITGATQLTEQLSDGEAVAVLRRCVGLLSYERLVLRLVATTVPSEDQAVLGSRLQVTAETEQGISATLSRRIQQGAWEATFPKSASQTAVPGTAIPPTPPPATPGLTGEQGPDPDEPRGEHRPAEAAAPADQTNVIPPGASGGEARGRDQRPDDGNGRDKQPSGPPADAGANGNGHAAPPSGGASERRDLPGPRRGPDGPADSPALVPVPSIAPRALENSDDPPGQSATPPGRREGQQSDGAQVGPGHSSGPASQTDQASSEGQENRSEMGDKENRQDSNSLANQSGGTVNPGIEAGDAQRQEQSNPGNGQGGSGQGSTSGTGGGDRKASGGDNSGQKNAAPGQGSSGGEAAPQKQPQQPKPAPPPQPGSKPGGQDKKKN